MMKRLSAIATVLAVIWGSRTAVEAQAVEATRTEAPLRVGPLQLFPTLTLREIGIDSNVYNSQVQREDFTYTVSPTLRTVLPIGEARLTTREYETLLIPNSSRIVGASTDNVWRSM